MIDATYTAEQLRERARNLRANGHPMGAHECEAHADALDENARLKGAWGASALAENARLKAAWDASHKQAMKNGAARNEWRDRAERAEAALAKLRQHAEAMAEGIESSHLEIEQEARAAYRADFPEGK